MSTGDVLVIFTRCPEPGRVKTRLIPVLGEQAAADLQAGMTRLILSAAQRLALTDRVSVEVHYEGGNDVLMRAAFGDGFTYVLQQGTDLGQRMHFSLCRCLDRGAARTVLIGSDCPGITDTILRRSFALLREHDCVIGPTCDGGYYLVGLKRPAPELFTGIPWGTDRVASRTVAAGKELGLRIGMLEILRDIDRPEDLPAWEEAAEAASRAMISVIIPALNEGVCMETTLEAVLRGRNIEPIVVDGGSTDRTVEISESRGTRVFRSPPGRGIQMNTGARHALGGIFFFLHADTLVPEGYDREIRRMLGRDGTTAGAFRLAFDENPVAMRIIAAGANARSRYLQMPFGDQGLFLTRDAYLRTGGFPAMPIMEDVVFVRKLRSMGRVAVSRSEVRTSSRRYRETGPLKAWLMNRLAMAAFRSAVPPEAIAVLYRKRAVSLSDWISLWKRRGTQGR